MIKIRLTKRFVLTSLLVISINSINAMEGENNIINEHNNLNVLNEEVKQDNNMQPVANNQQNLNLLEEHEHNHGQYGDNEFNEEEKEQEHNHLYEINNLQNRSLRNSFVINNNVYDSNNIIRSNIAKHIFKPPNNYEHQNSINISILKNKQYDNKYEKLLFNLDDSYIIPKNKITKIQSDIYKLVKDIILDRIIGDYDENINYKERTEEEKIEYLSSKLMEYYCSHAGYIFGNYSNNKYKSDKVYIPFKLLQIMYDSISDKDIAYKVVNNIYNNNKMQVNDYFKEIYNKSEFEQEEHKKTKGFLGIYSLDNKIPTREELDKVKGKALTDYWKYANHNDNMFPSINVQYTNEYLQESHKKWRDNIKFKLNNIIENSKEKPIDHIINYYSIVSNRAPNVYLSNDVISFIHGKLGINDVIYFIDSFAKIKQNYIIDDDLPHDAANFNKILNEYPNGNLKVYNINVYDKNCVICLFNSSDKYGADGVNRIVIDNKKKELYNRLIDANTNFNANNPQGWHINKYSKVTRDGNKKYSTVFIYYTR